MQDYMPSERSVMSEAPQAQGLYDPSREHDACGVGFAVSYTHLTLPTKA